MYLDYGIIDLIGKSGLVAKGVLLILFGFSILSWAVIFLKYRLFKRVEKNGRHFISTFRRSKNLNELYLRMDQFKENPLVRLFSTGFREIYPFVNPNPGENNLNSSEDTWALCLQKIGAPIPSRNSSEDAWSICLQRLRRSLDRTIQEQADYLEGYLVLLATTGNVTPFIGLFGTVIGIINAFHGISIQGTANIAAVAPGIAEALITTAAGLFTAIPAVIGFNYSVNRIKQLTTMMESFSTEFLNTLELGLQKKERVKVV